MPPRNIWVEDNVTVKKMRRNLACEKEGRSKEERK